MWLPTYRHAKAALLNDYFVHEYANANGNGVLIYRFDDTNPSKESQEFQDWILHDRALLGVTPDGLSYSSDYLPQMYDGCLKLIMSGEAYADDTTMEVMRDQRRDGIASAHRNLRVEDSLARFENMKSGSERYIGAKISVDHANKAMRDPVIYRSNLQPHHITGAAWKTYRTYDFCAPLLDSLENVTHALRTNEYRDRNVQYHWIQDALGIRHLEI